MAQTKLKTFGKRKLSVFELIVMVLLIAYCVAVVALLVWGFMASFRTDQSVAQRPWAMFEDLTIDNYLEVFDNFKTFKYVASCLFRSKEQLPGFRFLHCQIVFLA